MVLASLLLGLLLLPALWSGGECGLQGLAEAHSSEPSRVMGDPWPGPGVHVLVEPVGTGSFPLPQRRTLSPVGGSGSTQV